MSEVNEEIEGEQKKIVDDKEKEKESDEEAAKEAFDLINENTDTDSIKHRELDAAKQIVDESDGVSKQQLVESNEKSNEDIPIVSELQETHEGSEEETDN